MPVLHLLFSDVVPDGKALFDVVSKVIKVMYLVVAHGYVGFFAMQDCAEGSGKASCVGSSSASVAILARVNNILFLDPWVPKVNGYMVVWWQAGALDEGISKTNLLWRRHAVYLYLWGGSCDSGWERDRRTSRVACGWISWFCIAVFPHRR